MSSVGPIRLLIVDDCEDLASALDISFASHPSIRSVGSLSSADGLLDAIRSRGAEAVLLDLGMPGIDPLEALRTLRRSAEDVRVIAFSGRDDQETVAAARGAGADAFLRKGADPEEIGKIIMHVCGR
jgi:two-component system response regulator QseB